jgi:hypothetical protein
MMASLTKSELKDIVKECILEILMEGIRPGEVQQSARPQQPKPPIGKKNSDNNSFPNGVARIAEQAQGRRALPPAASNLASEFPKEQRGMMQQIFEDTIKNTLPSQMQADRSPGAAASIRADAISPVAGVDPMSIFAGSSNWADLAFSPGKK